MSCSQEIYREGQECFYEAGRRSDNPHIEGSQHFEAWDAGFVDGQRCEDSFTFHADPGHLCGPNKPEPDPTESKPSFLSRLRRRFSPAEKFEYVEGGDLGRTLRDLGRG